ncbi:MAG: polysaccharide biosynthesis tyrosine autokinase [Burkholderiaceae bacterium]
MERRAAPRPANIVRFTGKPAAPAMPSANARMAVSGSTGLEFDHLVGILLAHFKWLMWAGFLAAVVTAAFAWQLPSKYKSTVALLVDSGPKQVVSIQELRANGESREHFMAQSEILQSRELALETVRTLRLTEAPYFDPTHASGPFAWLSSILPGDDTPPDAAEVEALATERLMKSIQVEATRLSGTIRVTVETTDPELSAKVANQLATLYIEADRGARSELSRSASSQLTERAAELREKLADSEAELQKYRERVGIVNVGTTQQSVLAQQLNSITERMIAAKVRRIELEGAYQQLRGQGPKTTEIGQIQRDPAYAAAKARVDDLELRLTRLMQTYGSEHASVKEVKAQLEKAQGAAKALRTALANTIVNEYKAAVLSENELKKLLANAKAGALDVNRSEPQLAILEREVESNRQLYEMFVNRAKETSLAAELLPAVARIIDTAVPPLKSSGPARTALVLLAAVAAATVTALLLLARAVTDRSLRNRDQAEQSLGRIVLTTLPTLAHATDARAARTYLDTPRSDYAEAIRTARTGILLHSIELTCQSIMVTSTIPGEGKTTFACNLALACSRTRRTLLIDANLREPRIAAFLGMPADAPGLSNLVSGNSPSRSCLHNVPDTRLIVLPAGTFEANPQELLLSPKFSRALEYLARIFEVIIIDTPAVEPASDSVLVSSMVSATVVVAESGRANQAQVRRAIGLLGEAGSKVLGVVMNRVGHERAALAHRGEKTDVDAGYEDLPTEPQQEAVAAIADGTVHDPA